MTLHFIYIIFVIVTQFNPIVCVWKEGFLYLPVKIRIVFDRVGTGIGDVVHLQNGKMKNRK